MFERSIEILSEYKEDSFNLNINILFNFLRFVYYENNNIRESTVLGLVGAGGIGLQLNASIMNLAWTRVSLILLVIIATVIVRIA